MKTKITSITLDAGRKVPSDSQTILAWDDDNNCYYPMTRKELMSVYDEQIKRFKEEVSSELARYRAKCDADIINMRNDIQKYKDDAQAEYESFTHKTAEISERMVNLVESIDNGGK